jgi:plastocyanin
MHPLASSLRTRSVLITRIAALTAVAALTITACGDDDQSATVDATESSAGESSADLTVAIGDFVFDPTPIEVSVGDSIVWENTHSQPHTSSGNGDQNWDTGNIQPGDISEPVVFDEAGTYTYICGLHPFMEGTVEVSS